MTNRMIGLLVVFAAALFWGSLFFFAALRPDYSHATKAISELGAWGAPNMWWFNALGYIAPGLLLGVFAWLLGQRVLPRSWITPALLAAGGASFVISGVFPADMANMQSATTVLHVVGVFIGLLWMIGLAVLAFRVRASYRPLALVSFATLVASLGAYGLHGVDALAPGIIQRISFGVFFAWNLAAAFLLAQRAG